MRLTLALIFALTSIPTIAEPQDAGAAAPRDTVRGVVRALDGSAWVDATVILHARAVPTVAALADTDTVEAKTDARGRFRAEILEHRVYSAWAFCDLEGRAYRVTHVCEDVVAAAPVRLFEDPERHERPAVQLVEPHHGWKERLLVPLRCTVVSICPRNAFTATLSRSRRGPLELPPLPGDCAWIDISGSGGEPIRSFLVALTAAARARLAGEVVAPGADGICNLDIGRPTTLRVCVKDQNDKPLKGFTIHGDLSGSRGLWQPFGATTDEHGVATVTLSVDALGKPPKLDLVARGKGHAYGMSLGGGIVVGPEDTATHEIRCATGHTVRGRVLLADGVPLARTPLLVYSAMPIKQGGYQNLLGPLVFETGADGRFEIDGRANGFRYRIAAAPTAADLARCGLPPATCSQLVLFSGSTDGDTDLGDLRVDKLARVDLTLRTAGGSIDRLQILALDGSGHGTQTWYAIRSLTDRRGNATFLVPRGSTWTFLAGSAGQVAMSELAVPSDVGAPIAHRMQLAAETAVVCTVAGVDADDLDSVSVEIGSISASAHESALARYAMMCMFAHAGRIGGGDHWGFTAKDAPAARWRRFLSGFTFEQSLVARRADGTFACACPPGARSIGLYATLRSDGRVWHSEVVDGEPGSSVELTIAR